jgi:hypothetical protein
MKKPTTVLELMLMIKFSQIGSYLALVSAGPLNIPAPLIVNGFLEREAVYGINSKKRKYFIGYKYTLTEKGEALLEGLLIPVNQRVLELTKKEKV